MTDPSRPTRRRYAILLALLCVLAMITYMDRAANGSAKKAIMADLNADRCRPVARTKRDFFIVLMAFQIAYAIFEVPAGGSATPRGPRSTLLRVVLWWSSFVALTGFTGGPTLPGGVYVGFTALVLIQFLFGVGEAGAFPNMSKSLYNWFPSTSRGVRQVGHLDGARFMGGLTPLIWVLIVELGGLTWRQAMWLFAGAAALWCLVFFFAFTNKPGEHRR